MPILLIGIAVVGAVLAKGTFLFVPAILIAIASFWSNGVMANYAPHEAQTIPDWAAAMSIISTLLAIVTLVLALVLR